MDVLSLFGRGGGRGGMGGGGGGRLHVTGTWSNQGTGEHTPPGLLPFLVTHSHKGQQVFLLQWWAYVPSCARAPSSRTLALFPVLTVIGSSSVGAAALLHCSLHLLVCPSHTAVFLFAFSLSLFNLFCSCCFSFSLCFVDDVLFGRAI